VARPSIRVSVPVLEREVGLAVVHYAVAGEVDDVRAVLADAVLKLVEGAEIAAKMRHVLPRLRERLQEPLFFLLVAELYGVARGTGRVEHAERPRSPLVVAFREPLRRRVQPNGAIRVESEGLVLARQPQQAPRQVQDGGNVGRHHDPAVVRRRKRVLHGRPVVRQPRLEEARSDDGERLLLDERKLRLLEPREILFRQLTLGLRRVGRERPVGGDGRLVDVEMRGPRVAAR
jgi:hypothetical protein